MRAWCRARRPHASRDRDGRDPYRRPGGSALLACTAYWVLTPTLFEGNTPAQMLLQHVQAQPVPPRRDRSYRFPNRSRRFAMCLEKDPKATVGARPRCPARQVVCDAPWTNEDRAGVVGVPRTRGAGLELDHQGNARRNQHRADRLLESPRSTRDAVPWHTSRSLRSDRPDRRGRNGRGVSRER